MNRLFKALNDETRRAIIELLKDGPRNAGEIAAHFSISKPSISHHLDLLLQADLIQRKKDGQHLYYSLNVTILDEIIHWIFTLKK